MSASKSKALKDVPLFARCSPSELEFIASRTDEVDVPAGYELTVQGKPGNTFYLLLEGEADVQIDGEHRRILKQGDFFGEISMLDRGPATATVVTRKPVKLDGDEPRSVPRCSQGRRRPFDSGDGRHGRTAPGGFIDRADLKPTIA